MGKLTLASKSNILLPSLEFTQKTLNYTILPTLILTAPPAFYFFVFVFIYTYLRFPKKHLTSAIFPKLGYQEDEEEEKQKGRYKSLFYV